MEKEGIQLVFYAVFSEKDSLCSIPMKLQEGRGEVSFPAFFFSRDDAEKMVSVSADRGQKLHIEELDWSFKFKN